MIYQMQSRAPKTNNKVLVIV